MSSSKLIPLDSVEIAPYFLSYRQGFRLAGFIDVDPHKQWKNRAFSPANRLTGVGTMAQVDGKDVLVVPVFVNDQESDFLFDSEWAPHGVSYSTWSLQLTEEYPAIVFFKGNDNVSYGLRFKTFEERDQSITSLGADLGTLMTLLYHN